MGWYDKNDRFLPKGVDFVKKSLIFLLALLLVAVFALPLMEPATAEAAPATNAGTYYYDMVNSNVQWCYNYLKAFYDSNPARSEMYSKHFPISEVWGADYMAFFRDFLAGDEALKADHPEYEWKGRVSGGYQEGQDYVIQIDTFQLPTVDMQKRADARIQQIVSAVGTGDRYTKLRKLTDLLIRTSFYDPYLAQINMEGNYNLESLGHQYNQSSYGLLLEGIAVCDGFSQSVKLLCNELDIPCIIIGNAGHAWNLVQMEDGKWYLLDLTNACALGWDGTLPQTLEDYFQNKFLNNDEQFGWYGDPYMINIDGHRYVTEFPDFSTGRYTYTGGSNFSYTVPASTYTPGNGKFVYKVNQDKKTCTITAYEGKESGDLTVPEKLDGYTVTAIGAYAFYYRSGFTGKLTLPDTVESIGQGAFAGCYGLTSVKWPKNLHKIGRGAFIGCKGLTEITLPDLLDEVGAFAFYDCSKLKTVTFGSHIQTIAYSEDLIDTGAFDKIASNAVLKAPAGSVVQTYANRHNVSFQASGTMCSLQSADGKYGFDNDAHYKTCQHGGRFDYGSHSSVTGVFNCGDTCEICHAEACTHNGLMEKAFTLINQTPPTCNSMGYTGDWQCICGTIFRWGTFEGEPTGQHAPASSQWYGDSIEHYQLCSCGQRLNAAPHTGGTATATQQARCSVCGESYGELNPGYTGTEPPVVTTRPTTPTTGAAGTVTTTPTVPGMTTVPTVPGGTTAPTVPATNPGGGEPTVPGSTGAAGDPTAPEESKPTVSPEGTNAAAPTETAATQPNATGDSSKDPSNPGSPVLTIVLVCVGVAAIGAGGFFGFRILQKKKKSN